jgi:hypothetical protein
MGAAWEIVSSWPREGWLFTVLLTEKGMFSLLANVDYRLSFADQGKQTSVSVYMYSVYCTLKRQHLYIVTVYRYKFIYIYIYIHI